MHTNFTVPPDFEYSPACVEIVTQLNSINSGVKQKELLESLVAQADGKTLPPLRDQLAALPRDEKIFLLKFLLTELLG